MSGDIWGGILVGWAIYRRACLWAALTAVALICLQPKSATAQIACPASGPNGFPTSLPVVTALGPPTQLSPTCFSQLFNATVYGAIDTLSSGQMALMVVIPDTAPVNHNFSPVVIFGVPRDGVGTDRVAISATCPGGVIVDNNTISPEVTLAVNDSCQLTASGPIGTGGATVTYQATLSRAANGYSLSAGTVSGDAFSSSEIDISGNGTSIADNDTTPSTADNTDFGNAAVDGGTVARTFTVTNSGLAPLNLTSTPRVNITGANAADFTLTTDATTPVTPGGGTTTFTITFDPGAVGTRTATVTVNNDDADEGTYSFAIQGTGVEASAVVTSATVTIIKKTSPVVAGDGTFTFASDAGGLNGLSLATSGNSATSAAITVNAGNVAVTEDVIPGWKLSTIACTGDADNGSVVDVANRKVTIDVDANEAIVCTFTNVRDPDSVIRETHRVISNFMSERADVILSNDPDLADRFRTGGSNGQGNPLGFAAQGDARDIELSFATSLRAIRRAANAGAKRSVEGITADPGVETPARFDIWAQGTYARVDSTDRKSDVGLLHTGFDYRFSDNLLLGLMGQLDWTDQRERSTNTRTSADGVGWLIGPYLAARIHQNLILDGRAAWGQSYNNVNPLGLYEDDFNTNRWLVRGQVTGDFSWGNWTFNPSAGISYFSETQKSYVDSLNITIPSQTITLGRAEAGPEIRYNLQTKDGWQFAPHIGVKGIWDFDPANIVTAQGVTIDSSGLRARAEGGTVLIMPWGWSLNGTGFYDGIGAKDFQSYGGSVKVKVPLN